MHATARQSVCVRECKHACVCVWAVYEWAVGSTVEWECVQVALVAADSIKAWMDQRELRTPRVGAVGAPKVVEVVCVEVVCFEVVRVEVVCVGVVCTGAPKVGGVHTGTATECTQHAHLDTRTHEGVGVCDCTVPGSKDVDDERAGTPV